MTAAEAYSANCGAHSLGFDDLNQPEVKLLARER